MRKTLSLGGLKTLQLAEPVNRYQWANSGDMIGGATKQPDRFERVGRRMTDDQGLVASRGVSY